MPMIAIYLKDLGTKKHTEKSKLSIIKCSSMSTRLVVPQGDPSSGKGKYLWMSYEFDPFVHSGERDKEKEGGRKGELQFVCQAGVVSDGRKKRRTPLGIPCMRASIHRRGSGCIRKEGGT